MLSNNINPKEYLRYYKDNLTNVQHKDMNKDSPGIDFEAIWSRTLSLKNHEDSKKVQLEKSRRRL